MNARWQALEQRRRHELRLVRARALRSLDDAAAFLHDRGMLTRTADSALPSLFGACHEQPAQAGRGGFADWPRTKWIWSFQLVAKRRALVTKLHRGKTLYVSADLASVFDPFCRAAMAAAVGDERRLLDHLEAQGPATMDDIELELGWDRKRIKRVRDNLERRGAVVCEGLVFEDDGSWHFEAMARWDHAHRFQATASKDPEADLLLAGMRAAILAPEAEAVRWFTFPISPAKVDELVAEGRLERTAPGWLGIAGAGSRR